MLLLCVAMLLSSACLPCAADQTSSATLSRTATATPPTGSVSSSVPTLTIGSESQSATLVPSPSLGTSGSWSPSATITPPPTPSPTNGSSASDSRTITPPPTPTPTALPTPTVTASGSYSTTITPPPTPTPSASASAVPSTTPTVQPTPTPTVLPTPTVTASGSYSTTITPPPTPTPTVSPSPTNSVSEMPSVVWRSPVPFGLVTWMFRLGPNVSTPALGSILETNPRTLCGTCPGPVVNWGTVCSRSFAEPATSTVDTSVASRAVATALCYQTTWRLPLLPGIPFVFESPREIPGWEYQLYSAIDACSSLWECSIAPASRNCTHAHDVALSCGGDVQLRPRQPDGTPAAPPGVPWITTAWTATAVSQSTGTVVSDAVGDLLGIRVAAAGAVGETTPELRAICSAFLHRSNPLVGGFIRSGVSGFTVASTTSADTPMYVVECPAASCSTLPATMVAISIAPLRVDCQPVLWAAAKRPVAGSLSANGLFIAPNASSHLRLPLVTANHSLEWCNTMADGASPPFGGYAIAVPTGTRYSTGFEITSCSTSTSTATDVFAHCSYKPNATFAEPRMGYDMVCAPRVAGQRFSLEAERASPSPQNPVVVVPNSTADPGYICFDGPHAQIAAAVACAAVQETGNWTIGDAVVYNRTIPLSGALVYTAECDVENFNCSFVDMRSTRGRHWCKFVVGTCCGLQCPRPTWARSQSSQFPTFGIVILVVFGAAIIAGAVVHFAQGGSCPKGGGGSSVGDSYQSPQQQTESNGTTWGWVTRADGSSNAAQFDGGWYREAGDMNRWRQVP